MTSETRSRPLQLMQCLSLAVTLFAASHRSLYSQLPTAPTDGNATERTNNPPAAPKKVDVQPIAADEQIAKRLEEILVATGWFEDPKVYVRKGVVFLEGTAASA